MKYNKKVENRLAWINNTLRKNEAGFIKLYSKLKGFVELLENEGILLDYNFDEVVKAYSPNHKAHLKSATAYHEPIIETKGMTYMSLYIEDAEYREAWDTYYIDSGYGWASPFWESLTCNRAELSRKDISTINKIVIGVKIDYQICVNTNLSYRHRMPYFKKYAMLNEKLANAERKLKRIIELERNVCAELYGKGWITQDNVDQQFSVFTVNRRINEDNFSYSGNPFWENHIDWTVLFRLGMENNKWYFSCPEKFHKTSSCYSMSILAKMLRLPRRELPVIDAFWMDYTVTYGMVLEI